ncbi:MAG: ATP-binding cassette domain-containing protein, partial [Gammaproteobacteria bacterium]|nr:ATP-binding cassette domain-containing protein [Gammaproteobacteria bacterium]
FSGERIFEPVAPFSGGEKARLVLALMIRQGPNLLLLDEPTNHLDLEMRQALSIALIGYTGALVVISHDRHLLRSVCDELLIVHDGAVDRFTHSLDDYPKWLSEREQRINEATQKWQVQADKQPTKKELRQEQAQRRRRLKPLSDRVKSVERKLARSHAKLSDLDSQLADEAIYTDAGRKDELKQLIKDQAAVKSGIEQLELEWLEASEQLDQAQ